MPDNPDALLEIVNQGYVCPPEIGPDWRAAHEAGVDMSLIEDALRMTPMERLRAHQRALDQIRVLKKREVVSVSNG